MSDPSTQESAEVSVLRIQPGDRVDLESCPYLRRHPSAPYEFGLVSFVERETEDCIVIGYEGIDHVGYASTATLRVLHPLMQPLQ